MPWRFTWPASSSTGDEQAYAVARPDGRVVDADAGDDHRHAGPAADAGVAVGHVGGALLVAGGDVADVGLVVERVEGDHQLVAGQPEDDLDALAAELLDHRVGAVARRVVFVCSVIGMWPHSCRRQLWIQYPLPGSREGPAMATIHECELTVERQAGSIGALVYRHRSRRLVQRSEHG